MKIYDDGSQTLNELLASASSDTGATLLVPDLQRPYVWSPGHVTLLVDSLLRGWPFGTLLLWSVKTDDLASIPSRRFWKIADRTKSDAAPTVGQRNPPAEFRMVLDGQQRLQSLLLAFGGDDWGFRLFDSEWATHLGGERPRGKNSKKHWSFGELSLDLAELATVLESDPDCAVTKVDFNEVLRWVVHRPTDGRSSLARRDGYRFPIPSALDPANVGRYIRLSRLWEIATTQASATTKALQQKLLPVLETHRVAASVVEKVKELLTELLRAMAAIKLTKVSYLQLVPFDPEHITQDEYNDAIVNIFTRLNTAGRPLTRQEITFAWIKTGWDSSKTGGKSAGECFDNLRDGLDERGIDVPIDAVVGAVSTMWSVFEGKGTLLTAKDLLRGDKVRPMANEIGREWAAILDNAFVCAELLRDRGLNWGEHYYSLNVFSLFVAWRLLAIRWLRQHPLNPTALDGFDRRLEQTVSKFADRWLLLSQWSGRWAQSTERVLGDHVKKLAEDWMSMQTIASVDDVIATMELRMEDWLGALKAEATKFVEDLGVTDREGVRQYYVPLWLWHRLDRTRWDNSKIVLREGRKVAKIDVDHTVSVSCWDALAGPEPEPDGDDTPAAAIHSIGNCSLLEKTFNISKSNKPLRHFMGKVHDFVSAPEKIDSWAKSLAIDAICLDPSGHSRDEIAAAINARSALIKTELREYIQGTRERRDL